MSPRSLLPIFFLSWSVFGQDSPYLDLAPFATKMADQGLQWTEERDIREVRVRFASGNPRGGWIEYWFSTWPPGPPAMPTIEDPSDDQWQGRWLKAETRESCEALECRYTFEPLRTTENPLAGNLPGVNYRRTLKIRVAAAAPLPAITGIQAFSDSRERPMSLRIALGQGASKPSRWTGAIEVSNGRLTAARAWHFGGEDRFEGAQKWTFSQSGSPKGVIVDLVAAMPELTGSLDSTIVTVRAEEQTAAGKREPRTFSFNVEDLKHGPIYVPGFRAYINEASAPAGFQPPKGRGQRIRAMIPQEPEQNYERASREIPPLDPWQKQRGERSYFPLAIDASWQKFAFEYGGSVYVSKRGAKIKGAELNRVQWAGDQITWKFGTGEPAYFRDDRKAKVSVLDGYLPVVTQTWSRDGLDYSQEAFATALRGPLAPDDPKRSEQTPAILMVRLTAKNTGNSPTTAHFRVVIEPAESLKVNGPQVRTASGQLRATIEPAAGLTVENSGVHTAVPVPAGESVSIVVKLPVVTDLTEADARDMLGLAYDAEKSRVAAYWKRVVDETVRFSVPEPIFNLMAKAVVPHIHISTTKDPKSGLYMVPAASYRYQVYQNETSFQALLLDILGDHKRAAEYLETALALQGSRNYPGTHQGPYDAIFHGARVDEQYDYTASSYGLDHGTVLWALAEHYLYSRDREWLVRVWPKMRKAIDWILMQRKTTQKLDASGARVKEYGLIPAGHLEDNKDWAFWFSVNSYCWAGLDRSARALADIGSAEAGEIRREADAYKQDLRAAVQRAWESAPVVRLRDGTYVPFIPVDPYQRFRRFGPKRLGFYERYQKHGVNPTLRLSATREVLYGPIILLNLGVFEPDEPMADWILDDWEDNQTLTSGAGMNVHGITDDNLWFSQGGMVFQANLQNPALVYLMRNEVPAAIRSVYNNFVSCIYPDMTSFTEEYRMWRYGSGPFYKSPDEARFVNRVRDMLVLERGEDLWLAAGVPKRWLHAGISVERIVTYFGPVSLDMKSTAPGVITARLQLPARRRPRRAHLVVRVPEGIIRTVTIDGRQWTKFDAGSGAIELPQDAKVAEIRYR